MDIPVQATLPLLGIGAMTLVLSLIFCCYLWWLRRQGVIERGYKEIRFSTVQKSGNDSCAVCLDEFEQGDKIASCSCKHVFHTKCLRQWLRQSNTCPMCKRPVGRDPTEQSRLIVPVQL